MKNQEFFEGITNHLSNKISAYMIKGNLGKGTFGEVKLAIHKESQQYVAIKVLDKKKIDRKKDYERIQQEIQILQRVSHRNIIKIHEIIESKEKFYIIMEHAEKGDLFEYIRKKKKLEESEAKKLIVQLINAVEYLHQLNIMHRDLKPENIMLVNDGGELEIRLIDFGLSKIYEGVIHTACGSPSYASPEILEGKPYKGLQADIWSLGIVLFAMICGHLPFDDKDEQRLFSKIVYSHFHIPSYLSTPATDLLKKMLVKNPDQRINLDEMKKHEWLQGYYQNYIQDGFIDYKDNFLNSILKEEFFKDVSEQQVIDMLKTKQKNKFTVYYYLKRQKQGMSKSSTVKLNTFILQQDSKPLSNISSTKREEKSKFRKKTKVKSRMNSQQKKNVSPIKVPQTKKNILGNSVMNKFLLPISNTILNKFPQKKRKTLTPLIGQRKRFSSQIRNSQNKNNSDIGKKYDFTQVRKKKHPLTKRSMISKDKNVKQKLTKSINVSINTSRNKFKIEKYQGPLNLDYIFCGKLKKIKEIMTVILQNTFNNVTELEDFKWSCKIEKKQFILEVNQINKMTSTFILKLLQGDIKESQEYLGKIIENLRKILNQSIFTIYQISDLFELIDLQLLLKDKFHDLSPQIFVQL